jgi:hypothetical protein
VRALVVYESMFGNTQDVARAVAAGLEPLVRTEVVEVGAAPALDDLEQDLLVVGGPTHAFGLSRPGTREDAARQAEDGTVSQGPGIREWLDAASRCDSLTAAFDTHVSRPSLPGHASRRIDKRLRRLGGRPVVEPTSFGVGGTQGPLDSGELERAGLWGAEIGRVALAVAARPR